jgi:hypothetical protein
VSKRQTSSPRRRSIPKPRHVARSSLSQTDVTRGEYNRIIDILNERNVILNALREGLAGLQQSDEVQFKRIAQIQADLDGLRRDVERMLSSVLPER